MSLDTALLSRVFEDFRLSWRELAIADALYKVVAFVVLTPFVAFMVRLFVRLSGQAALSSSASPLLGRSSQPVSALAKNAINS